MTFARSVWKILVAIKDGLVLLLLLLFFWGVYAALTLRPGPGAVHIGALYLPLEGPVVEEKARIDPTALLLSGQTPQREVRERDLVRAITAAAGDSRIKAVVLDLEAFGGGQQAAMTNIGAALDRVRAANKPVLVRAALYTDDALQLAAHASEAWVDPLGGAALTGPGGSALYYKGLLDRLGVKAHVFKAGIYKSAVEPFLRADASPEAEDNLRALYGALWQAWQDDVRKARPRADLTTPVGDPAAWLAASGGDAAQAAVRAGLIDRVGDREAFRQHVAKLVGADPAGEDVPFRATGLTTYLADLPRSDSGKAVAVATVAGDIVDGDAGPGVAGGDRIAGLIDDAVDSGDYAALVLRVNSPGGSVPASERIRAAVARARAKGLPVAVSMGGLAASGGYWVSTPAQRIFAEPATITGSIGVFGVIPTFEQALAKIGVTSDGIRTTPLSGQPDVVGGLSPQMEAVIEQQIGMTYRRFLELVGKARHRPVDQIDAVAQGRVWDGAAAQRAGLVDQFGGLDAAIAWAAQQAGANRWHPVFLGERGDPWQTLLEQMAETDSARDKAAMAAAPHDAIGFTAGRQQALVARIGADAERLLRGGGIQAWCLACGGIEPATVAPAPAPPAGWLAILARLLG